MCVCARAGARHNTARHCLFIACLLDASLLIKASDMHQLGTSEGVQGFVLIDLSNGPATFLPRPRCKIRNGTVQVCVPFPSCAFIFPLRWLCACPLSSRLVAASPQVFDEDPHPKDVILIMKQFMSSKCMSQQPLVFVPFDRVDRLETPAPMNPAKKRTYSKEKIREYNKTAEHGDGCVFVAIDFHS